VDLFGSLLCDLWQWPLFDITQVAMMHDSQWESHHGRSSQIKCHWIAKITTEPLICLNCLDFLRIQQFLVQTTVQLWMCHCNTKIWFCSPPKMLALFKILKRQKDVDLSQMYRPKITNQNVKIWGVHNWNTVLQWLIKSQNSKSGLHTFSNPIAHLSLETFESFWYPKYAYINHMYCIVP
jgi:hypothetical protein